MAIVEICGLSGRHHPGKLTAMRSNRLSRVFTLSDAEDHIRRNGSLLAAPISTIQVREIYGRLEAQGRLRRNPWSGRLEITGAASERRA